MKVIIGQGSCGVATGAKKTAAVVLHECLFGKWNKVEKEMLKLGQERLRELGGIDK